MTRQAVIFGAGNIGRGFIGQLFSESDYRVTFVDVDKDLVAALNRDGSYHLQTVFNEDVRDLRIGPVQAIHGSDLEAVAAAVANADIGATAVGAGALKFIAPGLARGIARRAAQAAPPLNIIICENLKGAAQTTRDLVKAQLDAASHGYLEKAVGFVDTVIGRMVPMPTPEMRAKDVSFIRVEPYKELPVDRQGFRGEIPAITAMTAESNFALFTARKLYIHNCGHALLAYTGYLHGHEYGYEALANPAVHRLLDRGLAESVGGIVAAYGCPRQWLEDHVSDLLKRFANRVLADTIFRLGRDPVRKLHPADRLVGAANLALKTGAVPTHLAWGIAAALRFDPAEDPVAVGVQKQLRDQGFDATLRQITGIDPASDLGKAVANAFTALGNDPRTECPG
ncbi:MAG: mannitol-1-phosphate 5-dehydrogenase [Lentisphaerae bacterium]|nr:mannitol-1-phosphate 5-dehydrogenase [Lentisphaerota bacterium]